MSAPLESLSAARLPALALARLGPLRARADVRVLPAGPDLWVLRYVWDREEQIDPLAGLVNGTLKAHADEPAAHPLAAVPEKVDGEELAGQLDAVERELQTDGHSLTALARLRERVGELADRAAWVGDDRARKHLLDRAGKILQRLG